jgi:hypothetical protein
MAHKNFSRYLTKNALRENASIGVQVIPIKGTAPFASSRVIPIKRVLLHRFAQGYPLFYLVQWGKVE